MENNQTLSGDIHFRHLNKDEIEDPFIFINHFCELETDICCFRRDVLDLLKTAYSYNEQYYSGNSPSYGYYQQSLIRVMEAVYVLYESGYRFSSEVRDSFINGCRCLTINDIKDVTSFLEEFFGYKDLNEWRAYLDDILIYAYKEDGVGYFEYDETPFFNIGMLGKFVEAVFLIHELGSLNEKSEISESSAGEANDQVGKVEDESVKPSENEDVKLIGRVGGVGNGGDTSYATTSVNNGVLPERLKKEVYDFFSSVDSGFISEGLRYVTMSYLQTGFKLGFDQKEAMLTELISSLQRLFKLLDTARCELGKAER